MSNIAAVTANILTLTSLLLLGPALPSDQNSLWFSYIIAAMLGTGQGLMMVSSFARTYQKASSQGYTDEDNTNFVISGKRKLQRYSHFDHYLFNSNVEWFLLPGLFYGFDNLGLFGGVDEL